jgi:hypothetical protein
MELTLKIFFCIYDKSYGANVSSVTAVLKATHVRYLTYGMFEGSHVGVHVRSMSVRLSVALTDTY